MFSKKYRIKSSEINKIFQEKVKTINSEDFFVKVRENKEENNRFAVIIPKKIYKTSVVRHLYKRKIVSILKKIELNDEPKKENNLSRDFVVTLRRDISKTDEKQIEDQLAKILI